MMQMKIFEGSALGDLRDAVNQWLADECPTLELPPVMTSTEMPGMGGQRILVTRLVYHYREKQAGQTGIPDVLG